ncbi:hypothetical protein C5C18_02195 [Rathayibacter tritici]|uniref:DUF6049 family protein n=1 Tax=Rathayibacter tritici TaxID=33888 RepID=UPI000CE84415|nr:DUF6049 family protein [Rathayibacter tritici]PPF29524.1 hypothetical protein C5C06_06355 [Rathayibacter tritici]PPF69761.1 hypothetical protein C5C21_02060 [Rathayibacter tritici]PPG09209.1 hypothetical protein C5C18_02195 [Rathayibacter tritici]PPI18302.1 hypothetical protein C5D07_03390 [Rathayibacter tritici]
MHRRDPSLRSRAALLLLRSTAAAALALGLSGVASPALAAPNGSTAVTAPASGRVTTTAGAGQDGVLRPGGDLQLSIAVRNDTTEAIDTADVTVALSYATLDTRAELHDWLDAEADNDTDPVQAGAQLRLAPSSTAEVGLTVPVDQIPFSKDRTALGTHAVLVTVTGPGGVVSTARTAVELADEAAPERETGVSVLVPLTVPDTADGLLSAETLADDTNSTGTLTRQLDEVIGKGVTIGVDPRILASIRILGRSAPKSALDWLDRLQTAPNERFALPYADADVSAQAQAGLATLLSPVSFEYAIDNKRFAAAPGTATPAPTTAADAGQPAEDLPARPSAESLVASDWSTSLGNVAWPDEGTLRGSDLDVYAASGVNRTIVASDGLLLPQDVTTTARASVGASDLVVADSRLTDAFNAAATATDDTEWRARVSVIATDLAEVQEEGEAPSVVLTLGRDSALSAERLSETLDAIDSLPWSRATTLSSALAVPATQGASVVDSPESTLRVNQVRGLLGSGSRVEAFSSVLQKPELLTGKSRNDVLALLSVGWRGDGSAWRDAVTTAREQADTTLSLVSIDATDSILQVSRDSSIPVYVRNQLPWPVAVRIQASTSNAVLDIDEGAIETTAIDARSQGRVLIPVKARVGNGETSLGLQLTSSDGAPIGTATGMTTSVRADWETVGTLVIGIVLVIVFGLGIIRNILRRRRGDTPEEEDPNAVLAVQPGLDDQRSDPRG